MISLIGGGGKTSLMQALGQYYKQKGRKVLLTTTTKVQSPQFYKWEADWVFSSEEEVFLHDVEGPQVVLYAQKCLDVKKLQAPRPEVLDILCRRFDLVICEADGSKQLPLKFHTYRDPVIPDRNDFTIAVMGIWALGEIARTQTMGSDSEDIIDSKFLDMLVRSPDGLLKGTVAGRRLVLANGAVAADPRAEELKKVKWPEDLRVLAGSVREDLLVEEIR